MENIPISDEQLETLLEMKKVGWGDDTFKPKEGSYLVSGIKDLTLHEYVYINPPHDKQEFGDLIESMAINGQIEPVKVWEKRGTRFIIDGRHRYLALKILGADHIKFNTIPSNTTKDELKTMVIESENKRQMTPAQNAIRAWRDYKENHKISKMSMRAYASKYHTGHTMLSRCKTIENELGSKTLDILFETKQVKFGESYYKSLNQLITYIDDRKKAQTKAKHKVPASAEKIISAVDMLIDGGDEIAITFIKTYCQNAIADFNKG